MNSQSVSVVAYIDGRSLVGNISIPEWARLSDFLNDKTATAPDFISLTDVSIKHVNGTKEISKTVYINKQSIQMITTLENDSARGIGSKDGPKRYPFVNKTPVRTTIRLPGYELSGYLHSPELKEAAVFNEDRTFIPCTDSQIYDIKKDSRWKIDFAAINKNHISCFEECN
jgi:hypothetical protein